MAAISRRDLSKLAVAGAAAGVLGAARPGVALAAAGAPKWYFAEGTTRSGFDMYLTIYNPSSQSTASVTITYFATNVATGARLSPLPQRSTTVGINRRLTVAVHNSGDPLGLGREYDVSVLVETSSPDGIVVERPMYFSYTGRAPIGTIDGGHVIMGATVPRATWYFAEGYTGDTFEEYLCVLNPNNVNVNVRITYYLAGSTSFQQTFTAPSQSRSTVTVRDVVGAGVAVSAVVECMSPPYGVIAERPMYFKYKMQDGSDTLVGDGHVAMGVVAPSTTWFVAEGCTATGFDEYLTIFNPNGTAANVRIRFFSAAGAALADASWSVPATSRETVNVWQVSGVGRGRDVWALIATDHTGGVVVERVMYVKWWLAESNAEAYGGHAVAATPAPAESWFFAEGTTNNYYDEYIVVLNPNAYATTATIKFFSEGGQVGSTSVSLGAYQRTSARLLEYVPTRNLGIAASVTSSNGGPVVAERVMYFRSGNVRGGSHAVIGRPF